MCAAFDYNNYINECRKRSLDKLSRIKIGFTNGYTKT